MFLNPHWLNVFTKRRVVKVICLSMLRLKRKRFGQDAEQVKSREDCERPAFL